MKCTFSGLQWTYNEATLKNSDADCSVPSRILPDVITAVANSTKPVFDRDDDDDSCVDRFVSDIKEEDLEVVNDDLQSISPSVDYGVCDNIDKCSEDAKQDLSETVVAENCDANSETLGNSVGEKPSAETVKFESELSQSAVESAKPADILTDEMFVRWPGLSGRVGAGLQNVGNTCFVNATVQCLTYTVPLVNYLLTLNHSASCMFILV